MNNDKFLDESTMTPGVADNSSVLIADLYANRLVSQIYTTGDHVALTLTSEGALAFAKAIMKYLDEKEAENAKPDGEDPLLPKHEVMVKLGVTNATLWNWERRNYLVPVKIGRRVYYKKSAIDRLCSNGTGK